MFSGRDPIYNSAEWMVGHDEPIMWNRTQRNNLLYILTENDQW